MNCYSHASEALDDAEWRRAVCMPFGWNAMMAHNPLTAKSFSRTPKDL
jgi:hypothetical protein